MDETNEIIQQRLSKLEALKAAGKNPYQAKFHNSCDIKDLIDNFTPDKEASIAGRVMAVRSHGASVFFDLKDGSAKIQVYLKKDTLGAENFELFNKAVDIGDIVGAVGTLFKTRTNELSLKANSFTVLAKAIRPLPGKWHGLKDIEIRYRKRYLDLIANKEVKDIFVLRSRIISGIRKYLDERGYLEVETPMMHQKAGGAAGEPFKTHHKALNLDLYMRLAPELYLKKLLVGDLDKVYEINKSFRNEGISTRHNPEFTMLEVYTAYSDCRGMMNLTKELINSLLQNLLGKLEIEYQGQKIDFSIWEEVSFAKLMKDTFDIEPEETAKHWAEKLRKHGFKFEGDNISRTQIINIVGDLLEPKVKGHPVFVIDFFTELTPLAKTKPENPRLTERFELYIAGLEVANAYSELNDPIEQKQRFIQQLKDAGEPADKFDQDFVQALEYGMPPAGGLGIGLDRLTMILANQPSIRDVILFPQLKPQE